MKVSNKYPIKMAIINVDTLEFSAAAKGKYEIVKLLLKHGADPTKKNRDGATPLDLIREGDEDVADLLRGKAALLDAAKKGNLARVQRLVTPENINCRDSQGRNSTLLHLAGEFQQPHQKFTLQILIINAFYLFVQRDITILRWRSFYWKIERM